MLILIFFEKFSEKNEDLTNFYLNSEKNSEKVLFYPTLVVNPFFCSEESSELISEEDICSS